MKLLELQTLLHEKIPLTHAMKVQVLVANSERVELGCPLPPNQNPHGTAFAGSLYSLASLAGWSLVSLYAEQQRLSGSVVLRHADIRYLRPVHTALHACAELSTQDMLACTGTDLQRRGRARIVVPVSILCENKLAVQFSGEFVLTLGHSSTDKNS